MRKSLTTILSTLALVLLAGTAFAADGGSLGTTVAWASALGMGIASGLCGIAQGMGLKGAVEGTARNPEASGKLTITLILGLAFIESLAIYALVVNLILLFANPFAA